MLNEPLAAKRIWEDRIFRIKTMKAKGGAEMSDLTSSITEERGNVVSMLIDVGFESTVKKGTQSKKISGLSKTMVMAAIMATVGQGFSAGYNLGVVNVPQAIMKNFCNETLWDQGYLVDEISLELLWSLVVSSYLFGAMIGSLGSCFFANSFGRKPTLMLNSFLGLFAALLLGFTKYLESVETLIVGRIIAGIFSGTASTLLPMYLMETAPMHLKGAMGAMQQLGLTSGILISQILGQSEILGTEEMWPFLLSFYAIFILFCLPLLAFCPESPSYLFLNKKDEVAAIKALEKLRADPINDITEDFLRLKKEHKMQESCPSWSMLQILRAPELRLPLLLVVAMQGGQQISGISNVFYYSTGTFEKIGMTFQESQYGSIGAGAMNVIMSVIAVPLVNSHNRRTLLKISITGMILCLCGFTLCSNLQHQASWIPYLTITFFVCIVGTYGIGLGPLPFMIGSELFQQGPRAGGMGIGCLANWLINCLMASTFPLLQGLIGEYVFLIYVGFLLAVGSFLYYFLPETKGLEPVEVAALFRTGKRSGFLRKASTINDYEQEKLDFTSSV